MAPSALFSVDHSVAGAPVKRSFARLCVDAAANLATAVRQHASDRRLRDQLAEMDDSLLRDIGIADDEIHMIRARRHFTPRAWAVSSINSGWTA